MAYVNVAEWSCDQVADWLNGLDEAVEKYIPLFMNNDIDGHKLLSLRSDDLESLGVSIIGHQELILEPVGQLRNFHYDLDRENLQYLALKLSCVATSLYNELVHHQDSSKVETQTLSDVTNVISMVKPLALWLDRSPFSGQIDYADKKSELLRLSLEMATSAQRDRFAERPILAISNACHQLALLSDNIIQDLADPMILQPATLDLATIKKKEHELGFDILPSCNGIHQITDIKFGSPAHSCGKIDDGDEIVQVNYQTVVGWQPKEVLLLCQESPSDVLLTLKKRPRHTHTYGQIYMKPYRLPSKKRAMPYSRWGTLPSPRPELLIMREFEMPLPKPIPTPVVSPPIDLTGDSSSDESETLSPPASPTSELSSQHRIYLPKPRSVVQRRNTTSGSSPVSKRPNVSIEQFWREIKNHKTLKHSGSAQMSINNDADDISDNLCRRDKSVSCSTGLELSPRPKTCLGVGHNHPKLIKLKEKNVKHCDDKKDKTVKFQDEMINNLNYVMQKNEDLSIKDSNKEKGRLDKSFSTPAYDFGQNESEDFPLMREIIPESPTSSVESPSIIIHSSQKVEQILEFKKSSEQISDAMTHQKKRKNSMDSTLEKTIVEVENEKTEDKFELVMETINIALLEHKKKNIVELKPKHNLNINSRSIFDTEFGMSEQIQAIQNELVEAINEQRIKMQITNDPKIPLKSETPPQPPPRPLSSQKPAYIPPKPKHIQKHDIQVIPNIDLSPPALPIRRDILAPNSSHLLESKLSISNSSTSDLTSPETPVMSSKTLQKLEEENKPVPPISPMSTGNLDISLKCSTYDTAKLSISPANSMMRGILSSGKSKSLKKKNSILAKRRKISVKDLGSGDLQGWLYQRCRSKNTSNVNWDLRWYVLVGNTLYGFKNKDSTKAECLIFLSGFTVSIAQEVKSKQFAFKVYHTGTVFYFAAENADAMANWVEIITRATLTNNDSWERASKKDKKVDESKHFSETDYSDDDTVENKNNEKKSSEKAEKPEKSKFGSLKKFATRMHKADSQENVNHSSTSLDRKYLRFFSSKHSKNKEEKAKPKSGDTPIPTEQYRSYRKIPMSGPSHPMLIQGGKNNLQEDQSYDKKLQNVAKIKKIDPIDSDNSLDADEEISAKNLLKKPSNPINYIHASNPNLLDFEKSDFVAKPKSSTPFLKNMVQRQDNLVGFVTLEQFMLKKQEEERQQHYSNRVLMGVERDTRNMERLESRKQHDSNNLQRQLDKIVPDVIYGELPNFNEKNITPAKVEQIQNRSLPKTPEIPRDKKHFDLPSQSDSKLLRNNQKKKNDGYETIKYDDFEEVVIPVVPVPPKVALRKLSFNDRDVEGNHKDILDPQNNEEFKSISIVTNVNDKNSGYEMLYDDSQQTKIDKNSKQKNFKDLGYETLYEDKSLDKTKNKLISPITLVEDQKSKKTAIEMKKPVPPPKINLKAKASSLTRQGSSSSTTGERKPSVETKAVFKQGDSPEKFWLDSLRRNDRLQTGKSNDFVNPPKSDPKFFTKNSEPSTYLKSSEATIVKSEKMQCKGTSKPNEHKPLKSATQYTPMSLPLSPNQVLKTSPQFELLLDSGDVPSTSGIFHLRQIFQNNNGNNQGATKPLSSNVTSSVHTPILKEKTLLGSPRLHRAIFRKQHNSNKPDEWTQDFVYQKVTNTPVMKTENSNNLTYIDEHNNYLGDFANCDNNKVNNLTTPDYSHLEYPPVFEPETYTLTEPSLNKIRRKNTEDNLNK